MLYWISPSLQFSRIENSKVHIYSKFIIFQISNYYENSFYFKFLTLPRINSSNRPGIVVSVMAHHNPHLFYQIGVLCRRYVTVAPKQIVPKRCCSRPRLARRRNREVCESPTFLPLAQDVHLERENERARECEQEIISWICSSTFPCHLPRVQYFGPVP